MNKYFKNDIVEIVEANYKTVNEIPADLRNLRAAVPVTGARFTVCHLVDYYGGPYQYLHNHDLSRSAKSYNVTLYRRPLINWLKYIYFLITKKTIQ